MRAFIFLAVVFALFISTPAAAQEVGPDVTYGLCFEMDGYCDQYFATAKSVTGDTYDLTAYQYGCNSGHQYANGVLRVDAGTVHVSMTGGIWPLGDNGGLWTFNWLLSMGPAFWGPVDFFYSSSSGGVFAPISGFDTGYFFLCSDPASATDRAGPPSSGGS